MSQFDVYRNPSVKSNPLWPYYLIIQHDYFEDLSTRLVVPLVSKNDLSLNQKRITPLVNVNGADYYVFTPAMTFLDAKKINKMDFVCNVTASRSEIISAFDALLTNT
ncbi:CcdB family protein [Xenorhabdus nematophila]|uniref:Toxin CcdB n=1 Tax=Xenorhabdus nematophila (strain ATCC 19061 / DSM 3370 / CCUG 14189 / LMG 1036 / NCIMB 9965 / AN6) TaxID=406817 RepID=D3VAK0_XENNA|nr:CcdB family protein [Xenorhabdus nematophila]CEE91693.1 putative counterpart of the neighbouring CcdA-like protein [Xenorhabdus nematophila str. Anatoliense]CEF32225.1 putative counterpart of the neighbouring CcdA-like protein [Xenorhabdus nematophila str. Websteri]AYA39652.1 plasmid maintenance protein CcdB [Xenorhabdus nematophila]KHD29734.1 plasmid maintenance protein CcdB [Xenorhabdus nematophila]MBA0018219.1 CcdB family protein [Xenorhabdus nematophila]